MKPIPPSLHELQLVAPELCLVVGMCAVLLTPFLSRNNRNLAPWAALVFVAIAGLLTFFSASHLGSGDHPGSNSIFAGMLMVDYFSQTFKVLLFVTTFLVIWQWIATERDGSAGGDQPDFLCLILGASFGMSLMASASNLLMIFMAMEAASYPSYALAGFRKTKRTGAEASLKYVVFGSAASAIMVYGMSLIYGMVGSLDLSVISAHIHSHGMTTMLAFGILAIFAGIAFKLSAAPLHFWCPDVFQSAPTAVTTFLSIASKGAALCLLLRVLSAVGQPDNTNVAFTAIGAAIATMGVVTAVVGTAMAVRQTKIKRLLAFSSIAHAGYMIMAASLIVMPQYGGAPNQVAGALLFYLCVYAIMNMGAFSVVNFITSATGAEDIRDYAGLSARSPTLAGLFTIFLLSLFGMPTLGGFMGKIYIGKLMADAGHGGFVLIAVMLLCTVASLYFYMKPVYYMFFVADKENRPAFTIPVASTLMLGALALSLFFTGLIPDMAASNFKDFSVIGSAALPVSPSVSPSVTPVIAEPPPVEHTQAHTPANVIAAAQAHP
jgi:NADH-quinone oxidoreductase subunit N